MRIEDSPVFRKVIVPWYDGEIACLVVILMLLPVFVFSSIGISVAQENPAHYDHIWVPLLLLLMSGGVIVSTTIRLIKRFSSYIE